MKRRSFLIGLGALVAAPAIVRATSIMPVRVVPLYIPEIYGDGLRDDTAGLQALLNGEPYVVDGKVMMQTAETKYLPRGVFMITQTMSAGNFWGAGEGTRIITTAEPALRISGKDIGPFGPVFIERKDVPLWNGLETSE